VTEEPRPDATRSAASGGGQADLSAGDGEWKAPKPLKFVVFEVYFGGAIVLIGIIGTLATSHRQIDALGYLLAGVLLAVTIPLMVVNHYLSEGFEAARKIMCGLAVLSLLSRLPYQLLTAWRMHEPVHGIGEMMPVALTLVFLNLPETRRYCKR
jgi:hypothetical protein